MMFTTRRPACLMLLLILAVMLGAAPRGGADEAPLSSTFFAMDTCTRRPFPKSGTTLADELDLLKELGYAGVSWSYPEDAAKVAELVTATKQRGMKLLAIYVGGDLTAGGLKMVDGFDAMLEALRGSDTLVWIHLTSKAFGKSDPAGDAVAVPALQKIAGRAAELGLRVALYPHANNWSERSSDVIRIVKKVDRANFGATFNLCHALMVGEEPRIPELVAQMTPKLFMVTINGADSGAAGTKWQRLIQPLGQGTYDPVPLLRQLRAAGYTGPIGLQGYGVPGDVRENLTASMAAWRRLSHEAAAGR
jgi:sugar phosphate isomerase/epimerase